MDVPTFLAFSGLTSPMTDIVFLEKRTGRHRRDLDYASGFILEEFGVKENKPHLLSFLAIRGE
jgi:hypothetical protein